MSKFLPPESVRTLEKHLGPEVTQILVKAFDEVEARFAELEQQTESGKDILTGLSDRMDSNSSQ